MRRLLVLPAVVLPVVVLLTAGCTGSSAARVQTDEVVRATVTEVVNAPGRITAKATSTVTAPADGTVAALLVPDGATVTKGTILLRLLNNLVAALEKAGRKDDVRLIRKLRATLK